MPEIIVAFQTFVNIAVDLRSVLIKDEICKHMSSSGLSTILRVTPQDYQPYCELRYSNHWR